jgi:hypothetical protein
VRHKSKVRVKAKLIAIVRIKAIDLVRLCRRTSAVRLNLTAGTNFFCGCAANIAKALNRNVFANAHAAA